MARSPMRAGGVPERRDVEQNLTGNSRRECGLFAPRRPAGYRLRRLVFTTSCSASCWPRPETPNPASRGAPWFATMNRRCVMRALCLVVLCVLSPSVATRVMFAQQDPPTADATSALTCIQNALGGTAAFAAVSSLYIKGETKPSQTSGLRPLAGTREISVVFPDRYLRADLGQPRRPGGSGLNSFVGFDKGVILSSPRHPDAKRAEVSADQDFARQMLRRLPRKLGGVRLSQRVTSDSGRDRLAIEASGADGLKATLLVDRETCVPIALQYITTGAAMNGVTRVDLSEYRPFGGIRFPTVLKTSIAGQPYHEERVTSIEVNTPTAAKAFAGRR